MRAHRPQAGWSYLVGQLRHWFQRREPLRATRRRLPLLLEVLEDRLTPTTLTDQSGTLSVLLDNPGDAFTIQATGTNQFLVSSSSNASTNDLFAAELTGATFNTGTGQLTLTTDTAIDITDLATGGSVVFNNSGANVYGASVTVSLLQPLSGGVTFNGSSTFNNGLAVTTVAGDIVSSAGSSVTVNGTLTLTANTNITLNGSVTASGAVTLSANGTIAATNAGNSFAGGLTIAGPSGSAASASVSTASALPLNQVQVTGTLVVSAGGSITQSFEAITVGGNASFTTSSGDIIVGSSTDEFSGDISASVQGAGNIQLDNSATTTTLGTITLGTGNLTVNDDDDSFSASTIAEDSHAGGITTSAVSTGTVTFNVVNDELVKFDLNTAANNFGPNVQIAVNGSDYYGSFGDFLLQDVNAQASAGQLVFNTTNNTFSADENFTLDFPQATGGIAIDSLPGFYYAGNLTLTAAGDITETANNALTVQGTASFTSTAGNVTISSTYNDFSGDISASVTGSGNIVLDNNSYTTTLGAIALGTGNLTIDDDDNFFGSSIITEDPLAGGITTASALIGSPQLTVNIANDADVDVLLNTAANRIAAGYAIVINGEPSFGTSGDLGYRSTSAGASASQLTLNNFTVNDLTLEFDNTATSLELGDLGSLLPINGDVTVTAGDNITNNLGSLTLPASLTATAVSGSITIGAALDVSGDADLTAGGSITQDAPLTVAGTLSETAGGSITQNAAGTITASAANFSVTGATSAINLTAAGSTNSVTGTVSFDAPATGTGGVAFTDSGALALGTSTLGNGPFTVTAGGSGDITEVAGDTIATGTGLATFVAGPTGTTIDLSGGFDNLLGGTFSFSGPDVTTIAVEDANPAATLAAFSLAGVPSLTILTLQFDGIGAALQLATTILTFSLDLVEQNDIVLPKTATLTADNASDNVTLESLTGNIYLFGTVTVPGALTLTTDASNPANLEVVNPLNVLGSVSLNNSAAGTNTIVAAGSVTLANGTIAGDAYLGTFAVTSVFGSIVQAANTSLSVAVPASFSTTDGNIDLNAATNDFSSSIAAAVTAAPGSTTNDNAVTLTNSDATTTLGPILLGIGLFTLNDTYGGTGSNITQVANTTGPGIVTSGPTIINISTDNSANVNLAAAANLLLAVPNVGGASLTINGAPGTTVGNFGLDNLAPTANSVQVTLNHFTIASLTLNYELSALVYNGTLAPSSTGNLSLSAGGGITQTVPIVTSGSASFAVSGFVGDASIVLTNAGNMIATGAGANIRFNAPYTDNKQTIALVNKTTITLAASSTGLSTVNIASTNGNITEVGAITQAPGGAAVSFSAGGATIALAANQFGFGNTFYGPVTLTGTAVSGLTNVAFFNNNPLATLPTLVNLAPVQTSDTFDLPAAPLALGNLHTATLSVTAGGNITQQSGTGLVVTTAASFDSANGGIQLTSATNNIAAVSLSNTGQNAVALTTSGPLVLNALAVGAGALTITAGGAITETAGAGLQQTLGTNDVVAGAVTFKAVGNPVLLDNAANGILGPLNVTASVFTLANGASDVLLGNDGLTGSLTLDVPNNAISQAPGTFIQVGGSAYFAVGAASGDDNLALTNPGNTIAGPITLSSSSLANAVLVLAGPAQLDDVNVQGALSVTASANISQPATAAAAISAAGGSFTSLTGNITLANPANDFGGEELSLSAPAGSVTVDDNDAFGIDLGTVGFGAGGLTLTALGDIEQETGALVGSGPVTISSATAGVSGAIAVSLTQAANDVSGAGTFALSNISSLSLTNLGNIALTGTSTLLSSASVDLTAGGTVTLPNGTAGTLTLGSLDVSANQIQLGNMSTLATTAGPVDLTGTVVFVSGMTIDTSGGFGSLAITGNVVNTAPNQPLVFNLPDFGSIQYDNGTWSNGSNNLTVNGASVSLQIDYNATLAVTGGTLTMTGITVGGGAPSAGNTIYADGTLQVGGNFVVSDGGSDSALTVNLQGTLSDRLGSPDGTLTLNGANASNRIDVTSYALLSGFGGAASAGTILAVTGGGSISGTFANATDGNGNFLMGTDLVSASYAVPTAVSITPTAASASVPTGNEPDGDGYAVTVTGGSGLIVLPITTGTNVASRGLAIVVRNASAATTLTIKTTANGGDGFTSVAGIALDGAGAATIVAPLTNLDGNIAVGGPLTALTIHNWSDGTLAAGASSSAPTSITANLLAGDSINLKTPLAALTANEITGTFSNFGLGTITATSFGTITIGSKTSTLPADCYVNLVNTSAANPALKAATIGSTLTGNWDLDGSVGTITTGTTNDWNLGQPNGPGIVNAGLITNVAALTLGTATNVGIDVAGTVSAVTAISIDNRGNNATLEAGTFGTVKTTGAKGTDIGNFLANLTTTTGGLAALTVAGNLGVTTQAFALQFAGGNIGTLSAADSVQNVTIDLPTTATGGTIGTISAGSWNLANLTAAAVGTWAITANLPALLLGNFSDSTVTLTGAASGTAPTLGTLTTTGMLNGDTFDVGGGSVTKFAIGGAMDNDTLDITSPTAGALGSITAADWDTDTVLAESIGTLKALGRPAALPANPGLLGNITASVIDAFGGGIGTFSAAGTLDGMAGNSSPAYVLANGSIGTFTVGRTVNDAQVSTNLNGGSGGIGTITAGQWLDTDLAVFSLGAVAVTGFFVPDQLAKFPGNFDNSAVVVTGSAVTPKSTAGLASLSVANNLDSDSFNVPFGIGTITVTGQIGATGPVSLYLSNPAAATTGGLSSLATGATQSLTLDANQVGSITITGTAAQPGNLSNATLAIGYPGTATNATSLTTLSIAGAVEGGSILVKEGIGKFTVGQAVSANSIAAAYDLATATIGTLSVGSWNSTLAANSVGTFTVAGTVGGRVTLMGALNHVALGTFTATGRVTHADFQVTSGNVTSFTAGSFVDSDLLLGFRLVDALSVTDTINNGSNWEGSTNLTLGSFKTTAVLSSASSATIAATAAFQTSDVVAANLGTVALSGINPTPATTLTEAGGVSLPIPSSLVSAAAFGVGYRTHTGTPASKFTLVSTTEAPGFNTGAFHYTGISG